MNDIFMAKGKDEVLQMYLQRDEINKILKEHDGDILDNWFGSSSEHLSFTSGSSTLTPAIVTTQIRIIPVSAGRSLI